MNMPAQSKKRAASGSKSTDMVSFCPNCGSIKFVLDATPALIAYREYYSRCLDCGFGAKTFPQVAVKDLPKMRAQFKKKPAKKNAAKRKVKKGRDKKPFKS
ncbi:MAG: hypothetical protein Q7R47_05950 [Candidatus Diapherotrites archaeon]|nr:hypothetical protein [Candidatus Diapherotrites archaeon]